mgnify:CR=1 FL=1
MQGIIVENKSNTYCIKSNNEIYDIYRQKIFAEILFFRYNLVEQIVKVLPEFVKIKIFVIESRKR